MPLQTGIWTASVSGLQSQLQILTVDASGNVGANITIPGSPPLIAEGFWDEDSQKLLLPAASSAAGIQVFVGYMFTDPVNLTGVTGSVIFTLAGEVECFGSGLSATAKRSTFGWYAQIGVD